MEKKQTTNRAEKRRLRQFIICLALFGLIFAGRGLDLAPVERVAATVSRWAGADTDFRAVFAQMGESLSRGEPAAETFHALWTGLLPEKASQPEDGEEAPAAEEETPGPETPEGGING
jgi:hypothetical protein